MAHRTARYGGGHGIHASLEVLKVVATARTPRAPPPNASFAANHPRSSTNQSPSPQPHTHCLRDVQDYRKRVTRPGVACTAPARYRYRYRTMTTSSSDCVWMFALGSYAIAGCVALHSYWRAQVAAKAGAARCCEQLQLRELAARLDLVLDIVKQTRIEVAARANVGAPPARINLLLQGVNAVAVRDHQDVPDMSDVSDMSDMSDVSSEASSDSDADGLETTRSGVHGCPPRTSAPPRRTLPLTSLAPLAPLARGPTPVPASMPSSVNTVDEGVAGPSSEHASVAESGGGLRREDAGTAAPAANTVGDVMPPGAASGDEAADDPHPSRPVEAVVATEPAESVGSVEPETAVATVPAVPAAPTTPSSWW